MLWVKRSGAPHGDKDHQVSFTTLGMDLCQTCGHGVLESYSHDCWSNDEDWDMYWWYVLTPSELARLQSSLAACPTPLSPACPCPLHASLRESGEQLYGGVRSRPFVSPKVPYAWVRMELSEGSLRFKSLS